MSETLAAPAVDTEVYYDEQDPTVASSTWRVENLGSADWALGRLKELEREIAQNEAIAAEAVRRLEARVQVLNDRAMRGVRFFRAKLLEYLLTHRAELLGTGKKKSRDLPHGRLGFRKAGGGLEVVDKEALLAWAQAQPVELELVRITEAPAIAAIKAHCEATQKVPPGMVLQPDVDEPYAHTDKD